MTLQATEWRYGSALRQTRANRELEKPHTYAALLDEVTSQLRPQLNRCPAGAEVAVVAIPVVGFGDQSVRVLQGTLDLISRQRAPEIPIVALVLVNRPASQPADETEALVRARVDHARSNGTEVQLAAASVALPHKPRLGELRQLLADAAAAILDPPLHTTTLIIADDDLVAAPAEYVHGIARLLACRPNIDLAMGPVLFDDARYPSPLLPDFFVADLLRALLAAGTVRRLERLDATIPDHRREIDTLSRDYFESVILSGNLGVRLSALQHAGGFRDFNEITNVMRDIQSLRLDPPEAAVPGSIMGNNIAATNRAAEQPTGAVDSLYRDAVRVSSRRALRGYLANRSPTVAQWKASRFRAARVDEARIGDVGPLVVTPIRRACPEQLHAMVEGIARAMAETLDYFPADRALVTGCLDALGLGNGTTSIALHDADGSRSCVEITESRALIDMLETMQHAVLQRYGVSTRVRTVQLPLETPATDEA